METALRLKKSLAEAVRKKMKSDKLSITQFAKKTRTGRNAVKRLLDPKNTSVTLKTMAKTADAVGLSISLTAKPVSSKKLMELAHAMVDAPTDAEANRLKQRIIAGFYGDSVDAKDPAR